MLSIWLATLTLSIISLISGSIEALIASLIMALIGIITEKVSGK